MNIHKNHFSNSPLTGCYAGKDNEYLFIGREQQTNDRRSKLKYIFCKDGNWSSAFACYDFHLFAGYVNDAWVLLSHQAKVLRVNRDGQEWEKDVEPPSDFNQMMFSRARVIAGKLYGASVYRMMYRRDGINQWTRLSNGLPSIETMYNENDNPGFYDMDGFAENDIYAIGENADFWHWDGHIWTRIELPTDKDIDSICCGGDGVVYLNVGRNEIIFGRNNQWDKILHNQNDSFNNMCWFQDRIYMATGETHTIQSTLFELKEGNFSKSRLNKLKHKPYRCTFMDANSEVILMGTRREIAIFNGEHFKTILPDDPNFTYSEVGICE